MGPADELRLHVALLEVIERRREETGDRNLGAGVERRILELQLGQIEAETLANPGSLELVLVPLKRRPPNK